MITQLLMCFQIGVRGARMGYLIPVCIDYLGLDRLGNYSQPWIGELEDFSEGHGIPVSNRACPGWLQPFRRRGVSL